MHTAGAGPPNFVIHLQDVLGIAIKYSRVAQQARKQPGIFKSLASPGALMGQHGVGRITNQPHAAMGVACKLIQLMKCPQRRRGDAFEQYTHGIAPVREGLQHLRLAGAFDPGSVLWPHGVGLGAIGNEGHYVNQPALLDREREDMGVETQIHLRDIDQMLIDTRSAIRLAQLLTVDHATVGAGTTESRSDQRQAQPLQYIVAQR